MLRIGSHSWTGHIGSSETALNFNHRTICIDQNVLPLGWRDENLDEDLSVPRIRVWSSAANDKGVLSRPNHSMPGGLSKSKILCS